MSEVVRKGRWFCAAATGWSHRPLVCPDLECSRHLEGAPGEKKISKRVTKPGGRLQEQDGCVHSGSRMGRMPWPRAGFGLTVSRERHLKGPGSLVLGAGVHTMNYIIRLDGLRHMKTQLDSRLASAK